MSGRVTSSNLKLEIHSRFCDFIDNSAVDICFSDNCNLNLNIEVNIKKFIIFYGNVLDNCGQTVPNVLINLISYEKCLGTYKKNILCSTLSASDGSFNILYNNCSYDCNNLKLEIAPATICNK